MKLVLVIIVIASLICSTWSYPASGNPDDDAEYIPGGAQPGSSQPGNPSYPPMYPTIPGIPHIPGIPTIPSIPGQGPTIVPSLPPYPVLPNYPFFPFPQPGPQLHYIPLNWYSLFNGFGNVYGNVRKEAQTWPAFKPFFRLWPESDKNGTTTTTVKIVGDTKFIITETTHVQNIGFGSVVYKVRTIDVQPVEPGDVPSDDGDDERPTVPTDIDDTTVNDRREPTGDDGASEFDPNVDIDGNVETFGPGIDNDIARIYALEATEKVQPIENDDTTEQTESTEAPDSNENAEATEKFTEEPDSDEPASSPEQTDEPANSPEHSESDSNEPEELPGTPDSNEPAEFTEEPDSDEPANSPEHSDSDSNEPEELPEAADSNEPIESPEHIESNSNEELPERSDLNAHMESDPLDSLDIVDIKATHGTIEHDDSLEEAPNSAESLEQHDHESLSYETPNAKPGEWDDIEIETNVDSDTNKRPAHYNYYHKDSNENAGDSNKESVESEFDPPIDLTDDIAINHMLADQGAAHDPDAETFDVNLYNVDAEAFEEASHEVHNDSEPQSFDYLPYHHIKTAETHSSLK